ncbi:hypothetical protein MY4824_003018 [Beauveria thailandica]
MAVRSRTATQVDCKQQQQQQQQQQHVCRGQAASCMTVGAHPSARPSKK